MTPFLVSVYMVVLIIDHFMLFIILFRIIYIYIIINVNTLYIYIYIIFWISKIWHSKLQFFLYVNMKRIDGGFLCLWKYFCLNYSWEMIYRKHVQRSLIVRPYDVDKKEWKNTDELSLCQYIYLSDPFMNCISLNNVYKWF